MSVLCPICFSLSAFTTTIDLVIEVSDMLQLVGVHNNNLNSFVDLFIEADKLKSLLQKSITSTEE